MGGSVIQGESSPYKVQFLRDRLQGGNVVLRPRVFISVRCRTSGPPAVCNPVVVVVLDSLLDGFPFHLCEHGDNLHHGPSHDA